VLLSQEPTLEKRASVLADSKPPAVPETIVLVLTSVNVYLELGGRQVQLTLRDSDEGRLLERLEAVLQRFPMPAAPAAPGTPAPAVDEAARCRTHGVAMTLNHGKDGSTWHSHKTAEG